MTESKEEPSENVNAYTAMLAECEKRIQAELSWKAMLMNHQAAHFCPFEEGDLVEHADGSQHVVMAIDAIAKPPYWNVQGRQIFNGRFAFRKASLIVQRDQEKLKLVQRGYMSVP